MYDPETIKRRNAQSSLKEPEEVNTILVTVKEALRQVSQINIELKSAKQLRTTRPDLNKQLDLAKEFYVAERNRLLLEIEDLIQRLNTISEGLVLLLEVHESEKATLQGRLLMVEHNDDSNNVDTVSIREEVRFMLPQLTQRCEKIAVTIQEINQVIHEYFCAVNGSSAAPDAEEKQEQKEALQSGRRKYHSGVR